MGSHISLFYLKMKKFSDANFVFFLWEKIFSESLA